MSVLASSLGLGILLLLEGALPLGLSLLVNLVDNSLLMLKGRGVETNLKGAGNALDLLVPRVDVQPGLSVQLGDKV